MAFVGLILFLNLPPRFFRRHTFLSLPSGESFRPCITLRSVLQGTWLFLSASHYRGLLLTGIASGLYMGALQGIISISLYYAEDWTSLDGVAVQQLYPLFLATGNILTAVLIVPFGMLIDRIGGLPCIYIGCFGCAAQILSLMFLPPSSTLLLTFWFFFPTLFALYWTAILPFLLKSGIFPNERTISRDVGLWAALGSPVSTLIIGIQGPVLASFGTTGKVMLADRGQYTEPGYFRCFLIALVLYILIPLLVHLTGSCYRPARLSPRPSTKSQVLI